VLSLFNCGPCLGDSLGHRPALRGGYMTEKLSQTLSDPWAAGRVARLEYEALRGSEVKAVFTLERSCPT